MQCYVHQSHFTFFARNEGSSCRCTLLDLQKHEQNGAQFTNVPYVWCEKSSEVMKKVEWYSAGTFFTFLLMIVYLSSVHEFIQ